MAGRMFDAYADDEDVLRAAFAELSDGNWSGLAAAESGDFHSDAAKAVEALRTFWSDGGRSYDEFKKFMSESPRLAGMRVQWVESLGIPSMFASMLPRGGLFDGLKGVRQMTTAELHSVCAKFLPRLIASVADEQNRLKSLGDSVQTEDSSLGMRGLMSKFQDNGGFMCQFGDSDAFHSGLENRIGYPNPKILLAIIQEHDRSSCFMTTNYCIATTPRREFARLLGDPTGPECAMQVLSSASESREMGGPATAELVEIEKEVENLRLEFDAVGLDRGGLFSGEAGDQFCEHWFDVSIGPASEVHLTALMKSDNVTDLILQHVSATLFPCDVPRNIVMEEQVARGVRVEKECKINQLSCSVELTLSIPSPDSQMDSSDLQQLIIKAINHVIPRAISTEHDLHIPVGVRKVRTWVHKYVEESTHNKVEFELISSEGPRIDYANFPARRRLSLKQLMSISEVKIGKLRIEEAIAAYQYTGPMFQVSCRSAARASKPFTLGAG